MYVVPGDSRDTTRIRTRIASARNIAFATASIALLNCGQSDAAQFSQFSAPAINASPQAVLATGSPSGGEDLVSRFVRMNAGRRRVADQSPSWINPLGKPVVWYADLNKGTVLSFDAKNSLVGTLHGLNAPFGIRLDHNGNIYVANAGAQQVWIYKPSATVPTLKLNDPGFIATSVAISPIDGTVAVLNFCGGDVNNGGCVGLGNVALYKKGATRPYVASALFPRPQAIAYDASGKLWEGGVKSGEIASTIGYYSNNGKSFHDNPVTTKYNSGFYGPSAMEFDKLGHLDVLQQFGAVRPDGAYNCSVFSIFKPADPKPLAQYIAGQCNGDTSVDFALDAASKSLRLIDIYGSEFLSESYTYPQFRFGISNTIVFNGQDTPYGVAVRP